MSDVEIRTELALPCLVVRERRPVVVDSIERIGQNVERIRTCIATAAARSGRSPDSVRLVAVTKSANRDQIASLAALGCQDLAENRPQRLWERASWFPDATWHLVGHLQRNKIARTVLTASWIHSVDSHRLLVAIDEQARSLAVRPSILLQVNISSEPSKHGWRGDDVPRACDGILAFAHVELRGFMGMSSLGGSIDQVRREFASLRELAVELRARGTVPARCDQLSMGMSDDYVIAIEEGATMVRIGSALLEGCGMAAE
jgi:hypothetical protein